MCAGVFWNRPVFSPAFDRHFMVFLAIYAVQSLNTRLFLLDMDMDIGYGFKILGHGWMDMHHVQRYPRDLHIIIKFSIIFYLLLH